MNVKILNYIAKSCFALILVSQLNAAKAQDAKPLVFVEIARSTKLGLMAQFYFVNQDCSQEQYNDTKSACVITVKHSDWGIPLLRGRAIKTRVNSFLARKGTYVLERMSVQFSTVTNEQYEIGKSGPKFVVGDSGYYNFGRVQIIEGFTGGKAPLWVPTEKALIQDYCMKKQKSACEIIDAFQQKEAFSPKFHSMNGSPPKW